MDRFGTVFQECVKQSGRSVAWFAREISMNRGMLYNVWEGKKMPEERLQALLRLHVLTQKQEERLREAYYRASYGEAAFARVLFIQQSLAQMAKGEGRPAVVPLEPHCPEGPLEVVSNVARLSKVIRYILESEMAQPSPHIATNYPYSAANIDDLVYAILSGTKASVTFRHYIAMETDCAGTLNLHNIFAANRYLKLRHSPFIHKTSDFTLELHSAIYPCFFVTSQHVLLFHPESGSGLFLAEPEAVATIALTVSQQHQSCAPLALFPANEMELQQMYAQKSVLTQDGGGFSWWPCMACFCDCELLDQLFVRELPARDALIQIVESFYKTLLGDSQGPMFFTPQGFREFAQTGRFHEASHNITNNATPAVRAELLRRVAVAIQSKRLHMLLLNEDALPYPQNFCLDFYPEGVCARGVISEASQAFSGEFSLFVNDSVIVQDFKNFVNYVLRNQFYYPEEFALSLLEELAAKCVNA
jgi:hypothetical protein